MDDRMTVENILEYEGPELTPVEEEVARLVIAIKQVERRLKRLEIADEVREYGSWGAWRAAKRRQNITDNEPDSAEDRPDSVV